MNYRAANQKPRFQQLGFVDETFRIFAAQHFLQLAERTKILSEIMTEPEVGKGSPLYDFGIHRRYDLADQIFFILISGIGNDNQVEVIIERLSPPHASTGVNR